MKRIKHYFKTYPESNECHETSDGMIFHKRHAADAHAASLADKKVQGYRRSDDLDAIAEKRAEQEKKRKADAEKERAFREDFEKKEAAKQKKADEEAAEKLKAKEEAAAKKAEEEAAAKKKAEEDAAAKKAEGKGNSSK